MKPGTLKEIEMTATTYAQQAAAAARKGDNDNAAALYSRAALEADMLGKNAKARRHDEQALHFEALAGRDAARSGYQPTDEETA